jgi:hypothetical protein
MGPRVESDNRTRACEDLDVGQARGVVDADLDERPARDSGQVAVDPDAFLAGAAARHSMPRAADAPERLDVDVDQLARALALVTVIVKRIAISAPVMPSGRGYWRESFP